MAAIVWNEIGKRFYETGIDRGVFYPSSGPGVVWPGIVSIEERHVGGDLKSYYLDGIKLVDVVENSDFQANVTSFYEPQGFYRCDGMREVMIGLYATQQPRESFGLSYRTLIKNDLGDVGYKIHLVYNAVASPASVDNRTLSDNVDLVKKSWVLDTVPPKIDNHKPTAHLIINSTKFSADKIQQLEALLYGTSSVDPALPLPSVIDSIFGSP